MSGCADTSLVGTRLTGTVANKVRVTLRSRDGNGNTTDFCDRIVNFPGSPPYFKLDEGGGSQVDIYVEAFLDGAGADGGAAAGVTRVASGSLVGIDPSAKKLGALRLFPTESTDGKTSAFSCAPQPADLKYGFPRAFHTATLLPDGRVLFYGGLAATATDPTMHAFPLSGAMTTDIAEIYDPRDQTRIEVNPETVSVAGDLGVASDMAIAATDLGAPSDMGIAIPTRPGRAFHSAALLPTHAPCNDNELAILIVGGITSGAPNEPVLTIEKGISTVASRFQSSGSAANAASFDIHAAANEVFCLDPKNNTGRHMALPGAAAAFRAAAVGPAGLVAAGGIDFDNAALNTIIPPAGHDLDVFSLNAGALQSDDIATQREGASLTILPNGQGLLWGGSLYGKPIGELLGALNDAPYSTTVSVTGAAATAFHTATLQPDADPTMPPNVLVTGGFAVTSDNGNIDPPLASSAVWLLSVNGGVVTEAAVPFGSNPQTGVSYPAAASCSDETRYRPAGFESAVPLSRGRILVSGGTPSTAVASSRCNDCPTNVTTTSLCATGQASIYEGNTLVPTASMAVPRFGHTSTVLADGSVMIFGGIGQQPTATGATTTNTIFLNDVEIYNPKSATPTVDATSGIDPDDPLADVLKAQGLQRAPGGQIVDPKAKNPTAAAKTCGTL